MTVESKSLLITVKVLTDKQSRVYYSAGNMIQLQQMKSEIITTAPTVHDVSVTAKATYYVHAKLAE